MSSSRHNNPLPHRLRPSCVRGPRTICSMRSDIDKLSLQQLLVFQLQSDRTEYASQLFPQSNHHLPYHPSSTAAEPRLTCRIRYDNIAFNSRYISVTADNKTAFFPPMCMLSFSPYVRVYCVCLYV